MKHILNNLSEEEKNAIREQHTGTLNVVTENFHKLLSSKLGDSKPFLSEQESIKGNEIQKIVNDINYNLSGDVKGWHLDDLSDIFNSKVFGKKIEGTNLCVLLKVLEYFKASEGLTTGKLTDTKSWTKTLGSLTNDRLGQGLIQKLAKTGEVIDKGFDAQRDNLVWELKNELNGFCKRK
jgi:hypothetical protein